MFGKYIFKDFVIRWMQRLLIINKIIVVFFLSRVVELVKGGGVWYNVEQNGRAKYEGGQFECFLESMNITSMIKED